MIEGLIDTLKNKYQDHIDEIILPTKEDLELASDAESLLEKFTDDQPQKHFLLALINFLRCSIITYHQDKIRSHKQRREWLNGLLRQGETEKSEKIFFENNRLRINKIFPLLWALDELPEEIKEGINSFWEIFQGENYSKLSNEEKN